jgi:hypothetical protein
VWREWIQTRLEVEVRVAEQAGTQFRYGLVSHRWSEAPSFLFGEDSEEAGAGQP